MYITSESVFKRLFYEICDKHSSIGLKDIKTDMEVLSNVIESVFKRKILNKSLEISDKWTLVLQLPGEEKNYIPIKQFSKLSRKRDKIILEDFDNDWKGYKLIIKEDKFTKNDNFDSNDTYNLKVNKNDDYILDQDRYGFNVTKMKDGNFSFDVKDYFMANIKSKLISIK